MNITASHEKLWTDNISESRFTTFLSAVRRRLRTFATIVSLCVVGSITLAFIVASYWLAEIVVMPVSNNSSVNVGNALAGGLGSLAGLGALLGRPSSNEDEALAVLRSRELFDTYATQQN